MSHAMTAEELYLDLKRMPTAERQRFFVMLSEQAFGSEDMSHEQLFGHLKNENLTAQEAAEYLEVSMTTFRRYISGGKLVPISTVGRNQLFAVPDLKAFKRALKNVKVK